MHRILFAGGEIVTGSEIAEAVVGYAEALAQSGTAATVTVPVLHDGVRTSARLLLGPASQLFAEQITDDADELVDAALVASVRRATVALVPHPFVNTTGPTEAVSDLPVGQAPVDMNGVSDADLDWPSETRDERSEG